MLLHFDCEYKEEDADFEVCFPVRQANGSNTAIVRELPGGRCVSLVHRGPCEELGRAMPVFSSMSRHTVTPSRHRAARCTSRGPGMVSRGNPKHYITEIQMLVR